MTINRNIIANESTLNLISKFLILTSKTKIMEKKSCTCGSSHNKVVITCSGAADLGYIADQVARRMSLESVSKMSCLALFASCSDQQIENFKSKEITVIDGCQLDCGKKIMEQKGIEDYNYVRLTDFGYEKGKTPAEKSTVNEIYQKVVEAI